MYTYLYNIIIMTYINIYIHTLHTYKWIDGKSGIHLRMWPISSSAFLPDVYPYIPYPSIMSSWSKFVTYQLHPMITSMIVDQFTQTKTDYPAVFLTFPADGHMSPKLFSIPLFWLVANVPIMGDLVSRTKHASEQFVNLT